MFNKLDSMNSRFVATRAGKLQNRTSTNKLVIIYMNIFCSILRPVSRVREAHKERGYHISLSLFHFMRRLLIEVYTSELCLENAFVSKGSGGGGRFFVWLAKLSPLGCGRKFRDVLLAKWTPLLRERAKTQKRIAKDKKQRLRRSSLNIWGMRDTAP